jgi:hypothetical protein
MDHLVKHIRWVMLVSGALTFSMIQAAFAPDAALASMFGAGVDGTHAQIVVRNWGVLIALMGAMLVYGAFRAHVRRMALTVAGLSKLAFIALVLAHGAEFVGHHAGIAVAIDSVMVTLFAAYLAATPRTVSEGRQSST